MTAEASKKRVLIAYFSYSPGNTKRIAEFLRSRLGEQTADIVRIETVKPYSSDYDAVVGQGQREVNSGFEPEIKPLSANPADYDVIVVGTPTWWYKPAPAVMTFLHSQSWKGKKVVLFQTTAGWPGSVLDDLAAAIEGKGGHVASSRRILFDASERDRLRTRRSALDAWADELRGLDR